MKHSFAPFDDDFKALLAEQTGIAIFREIDFDDDAWFCVSARDDDGEVAGCCVFEFKSPFDAHFSIAIRDPRCITRKIMRTMFKAVFTRAARVTALVDPANESAIEQVKRLGFVYEGYLRRGFDGHSDAELYGMLPEDCPWLWDPKPDDRQIIRIGGLEHGLNS